MNIFVTGGGGFIGRNVARDLRNYNHHVIAPTHQELDMTNLPSCLKFITENKIDAIVHTAFKGHFASTNQYQDFLDNLKMFDTLAWIDNYLPTVIIGSGAEFDRRFAIDFVEEEDMFKCWPVDFYGLAKNIIARRTLDGEIHFPFLLRLFGCFGCDEPDFRFIKRSILRLKEGLPIEIQKNKEMDFFFVEDVARVINFVLLERTSHLRNLNLTYCQKHDVKPTLADIGEIICTTMKIPSNIVIKEKAKDHPYTGNGWKLGRQNIQLIGLERGIYKMVKDLT